MTRNRFEYDVVIVGGGAAGLSAALVLGRACRNVLVCDEGKPRNRTSPSVHGFFTRDGISPADLLRIGREQLEPYGVARREGLVTDVQKQEGGFRIAISDGGSVTTRKLILATGARDELPEIEGLAALWGAGVLHCPYCHGWEVRNTRWAFIARAEDAAEWGIELLGWTDKLTYCSNGPSALSDNDRRTLLDRGVAVREEKIRRLDGEKGLLKSVIFEGGETLDVDALFVRTIMMQRSPLPESLGCKTLTDRAFKGGVETDLFGATNIDGVFVIGDASRGMPQVSTAVSDGTLAAVMVNKVLVKEDAQSR